MLFVFELVFEGSVKVGGFVAANNEEEAKKKVKLEIEKVPYNYLTGEEELRVYKHNDVFIEQTSYLQWDQM